VPFARTDLIPLEGERWEVRVEESTDDELDAVLLAVARWAADCELKRRRVLVDGAPVKSCTMLAVQADGHAVTTVEGLGTPSGLDPVQEGFSVEHGLQCGFCTPGMIMAAKSLLDEQPNPTEEEVREGLEGNLCRCTGYQNIVKAVLWAARKENGGERGETA